MNIKMENYAEYIAVFNKLGYDVQKKGAVFFFSLLDDVRSELANGLSDEEIMEKIPGICLDEYHFYFEIKKSAYMKAINDFLNTRDEKKGKKLLPEVIDSNKEISLEEAALIFAKYFNAKGKVTEIDYRSKK